MPEAQNPFLDPEPPHWAARGLAYTFISIFVIAILAAWLVSVPETVSGQFTLVPIRGTDPIRAQKEGVLVEVAVEEGDTVAVGTTLFLIHSGPMSDRSSDLRTLETQLRANQERIRIAASQYETRRRQDDSEQRRLETKVTFLDGLITSKKKRLVLARELADSALSGTHTGSINRLDYTRLELEATSLAEEVQTAQNDLDDAKAALVRLGQDEEARDLEYRETRRGLDEAMDTERIRINSMHQDIGVVTDSGLEIRAHCAGTILHLRVNGPGAVVTEGEILGELACRGDRLQGELELPQAGVPLVRVGQGVKLRLDAFPYQRFGIQFGIVRWLGPTGESAPTPGTFRALVDLASDSVRVGAQMRPLLPGMRGQADIVIGKRRLYSYAFEPIRALRENFRQVPAK
jgi:membrane fusion protein